MDLRHHFDLMAGWHVWAFERLFAAVDTLDEADYRRDVGLFFTSVHGTLNHMLLVEQLWKGRLTGDLFEVGRLSDEIEPDRAALRQRLLAHAATWGPMVAAMNAAEFESNLRYRSMAGDEYELPRVSIVHTMFTHAAHHRGQITTALTQLHKEAPEMDFPYFLLSLPKEKLYPQI
jgi:uncharacterized damage-inducible protein DinB